MKIQGPKLKCYPGKQEERHIFLSSMGDCSPHNSERSASPSSEHVYSSEKEYIPAHSGTKSNLPSFGLEQCVLRGAGGARDVRCALPQPSENQTSPIESNARDSRIGELHESATDAPAPFTKAPSLHDSELCRICFDPLVGAKPDRR